MRYKEEALNIGPIHIPLPRSVHKMVRAVYPKDKLLAIGQKIRNLISAFSAEDYEVRQNIEPIKNEIQNQIESKFQLLQENPHQYKKIISDLEDEITRVIQNEMPKLTTRMTRKIATKVIQDVKTEFEIYLWKYSDNYDVINTKKMVKEVNERILDKKIEQRQTNIKDRLGSKQMGFQNRQDEALLNEQLFGEPGIRDVMEAPRTPLHLSAPSISPFDPFSQNINQVRNPHTIGASARLFVACTLLG